MTSITRIYRLLASIEVYCCRFSAMPIGSLALLTSWASHCGVSKWHFEMCINMRLLIKFIFKK